MKIKTQDLTGPALDWAVAKAADYLSRLGDRCVFTPSTRWAQGGPIIEREGILFIGTGDGEMYNAWIVKPYASGLGPTHLIAAMRCYVASKLGEEVDIPEELL